MTFWIIETLTLLGMVTLIWAMLDILGSDYHVEKDR
jgi:hypothetical protein